MRSILILLATSIALTGCSMMPFGESEAEKPTSAASGAVPLAVTTKASTDLYQIKDADRGMVRRVKVLLNGRTIDTLVMSKGREGSTTHCCTADGCQQIEPVKACTTFRMTCDQEGECTKADANQISGKL